MQFATTGMNECLHRKLKSLTIFWQKGVSSSGKLAEIFKNCPHQELVSKFVEISSKFGEIWQPPK
jgi:hypothetical protein